MVLKLVPIYLTPQPVQVLGWIAIADDGTETIDFGSPAEAEVCHNYFTKENR